jgi:alpha-beta hydrolase superfamily lysophospholipase
MLPPAHAPTATGALVTGDGVRLFTQRWLPEGSPRGRAVLVHGYAEHSGRYGHVARALVRGGLAVHAYDQRGHGRSGGRTAFVRRFGDYLRDLGAVVEALPRDGLPRVLLGHSMGGLVAALFVLEWEDRSDDAVSVASRQQAGFRALVLSSPAVNVAANAPAPLRLLAPVVSRLAPRLPTVPLPEDAISRDDAVLADAYADPLNFAGRTLARTGAEMLSASRRLRAQMHRLRLPLYVTHGTDDVLTDPAGSRALVEAAAAPDKTLRLYHGLRHETYAEPEGPAVLHGLATWLDRRMEG